MRTGCRCGCLRRHGCCRHWRRALWRSRWCRSRGSFPLVADPASIAGRMMQVLPVGQVHRVAPRPPGVASDSRLSSGPDPVAGQTGRADRTWGVHRDSWSGGARLNVTPPAPGASRPGRIRPACPGGRCPAPAPASRVRRVPGERSARLPPAVRRRRRTAPGRSGRRRRRPRRTPASRSRSISSSVSGIAAARGPWCSQSSVAGSSRPGSAVSAWTSRAARPAVRAASACGTVAPAAPPRACEVSSRCSGTSTTGSIEGCGCSRTARAPRPSPSHQAMVSPPSRAAAALSGWPSRRPARPAGARPGRGRDPPVPGRSATAEARRRPPPPTSRGHARAGSRCAPAAGARAAGRGPSASVAAA